MKIKVEYEIEIPDGCSDEDIEEWVRFETGENGSMLGSNSLASTPMTPLPFSVDWEEI